MPNNCFLFISSVAIGWGEDYLQIAGKTIGSRCVLQRLFTSADFKILNDLCSFLILFDSNTINMIQTHMECKSRILKRKAQLTRKILNLARRIWKSNISWTYDNFGLYKNFSLEAIKGKLGCLFDLQSAQVREIELRHTFSIAF